jgi:hypothetical protein
MVELKRFYSIITEGNCITRDFGDKRSRSGVEGLDQGIHLERTQVLRKDKKIVPYVYY